MDVAAPRSDHQRASSTRRSPGSLVAAALTTLPAGSTAPRSLAPGRVVPRPSLKDSCKVLHNKRNSLSRPPSSARRTRGRSDAYFFRPLSSSRNPEYHNLPNRRRRHSQDTALHSQPSLHKPGSYSCSAV